MTLELSLMAVSAVGMLVLIIHKGIELARGTHESVKEAREKADPIFQNLHHTTGKFFSYFTIHNAVLVSNYLLVRVVRLCMHASNKVHTVSSEIVTKASKKTEDLSRGGAASFYLKKIKESKDKSESMAVGEAK